VGERAASRICVHGAVTDLSVDDVRALALRVGVLGWVRRADDGGLCAHLEGSGDAVQELTASLRAVAGAQAVSATAARTEGHEQFAVRGVPVGVFVVQEHQATAHHFDFRLEVDGVMRSWAVPKGPSMDPAVKRFAVQVDDHSLGHNDFEGRTGGGGVIIWDCGPYEQGGRVPWPAALDRGHAVFVLHGQKLEGGFALQRTRGGAKPQWLLVKRRDEWARSASDIAAEQPHSVRSGMTLAELLSSG
jgi:DNA ligase D-like protein (predicted 3'-phosphoesterase)